MKTMTLIKCFTFVFLHLTCEIVNHCTILCCTKVLIDGGNEWELRK